MRSAALAQAVLAVLALLLLASSVAARAGCNSPHNSCLSDKTYCYYGSVFRCPGGKACKNKAPCIKPQGAKKCAPKGAQCKVKADCCSGFCGEWPRICKDKSTCVLWGDTCIQSSECCTNICLNGRCCTRNGSQYTC